MVQASRPARFDPASPGGRDIPDPAIRRIVGLIPAAGRATRLGEMPWSKELLPVGFQPGVGDGHPQPKPVAQYLVEQMKQAGCTQVFVIVRRGKWDIADYFGDGRRFGLDIAYLMVHEPWGPPFTLSQAAPFTDAATVVTGFPDIVIHPRDALAQTVARLHATEADVVVATFPAPSEDGCDLVQSDASGRVFRLVPKEDNPELGDRRSTWILAAWGPRFTAFLRDKVRELAQIARARGSGETKPPEWPVGSVIASAIQAGLAVNSVHFAHGAFLDVGAPHRLVDAIRFPGVWDGQGQPPA